jgi:hypothetical protein
MLNHQDTKGTKEHQEKTSRAVFAVFGGTWCPWCLGGERVQ